MKRHIKINITEVEKGAKYRIIANMGWDEKTKSYPRKTRVFYGTKREAEAFARDWVYELENPEEVLSTDTVGEWLDFWLENDVKILLNWEQNTERRARGIITHNIKPNIGDVLLTELNSEHILDMFVKLSTDGGRFGKGLSKRSILYVYTILNQSLNHAVQRGKIKENPAKGLRPANKKEKSHKKWVVLDAEQLNTFLNNIKEHQDYYEILVDSYTGLRQSELLGLTWEKFLLEERKLKITGALHKTYDEEEYELRDRTKNETSTRNVNIGEKVISALLQHKENQIAKGIDISPNALIFTEVDGSPKDADNLSSRFRKLAAKHGHKGMTFHHLRHTYATILLSDGAYINEVAEQLGHADPRITLSIYGHVLPKRPRTLADHFDSIMEKATKK